MAIFGPHSSFELHWADFYSGTLHSCVIITQSGTNLLEKAHHTTVSCLSRTRAAPNVKRLYLRSNLESDFLALTTL